MVRWRLAMLTGLASLAAVGLADAADSAAISVAGSAANDAPVVRLSGSELTLPDLDVVSRRLDAARQQIQPSLGASRYGFDRAAIQTVPQGDASSLQQVLLQAPGVTDDSFGQIHVRNEHANVQYRLNGVQLPEGLSVFGQVLSTRFTHSLSLVTGSLPAQYGFNHAGVVDITTKSGTTDPGGAITMYGGSRGVLQPSFEYGGRTGAVDYFFTGEYLHSHEGIENAANTFNASHDTTTQFHGLAHISGIIDDQTRISLLGGSFHGDYQIPTVGHNTPGLGLTANGVSSFDSNSLTQHQRELSQFAILSLQKHYDAVDVQFSGFSRYSSLYYTPDPLGDLLFTGIAQTAARSSWANGLQSDASWRINEQHTLRAGFLMQIERSVSKSTSSVLGVDAMGMQISDQPFAVRDSSGKTGNRYGIYLQDEWRVLPTVTVNYGARFDVVDEYTHDQDVSPRLNVVWQATASTTVHVGYARYFTPPPFELVGNQTITRFLNTTASPTVQTATTPKAERAHYFDAGISQVIIPGLIVGVDAYFKRSHNLIDEGQFGSPILLTAYNYAKGQQQGLELTGTYDQGPMAIYANFAYSRGIGKNIDSSEFNFSAATLDYVRQHYIHLDHDQRFTGSGGAAYTVGFETDQPLRLSADLLVGSGLRRGGDTPNGRALPGYATANLSAVQRLTLVRGRATELRVDVLNVLDRRYELRDGSGVGVGAPQYGLRRAILAGVTQRF